MNKAFKYLVHAMAASLALCFTVFMLWLAVSS